MALADGLDAYLTGRNSMAGIMTSPPGRTVVALGARIPLGRPRSPPGEEAAIGSRPR
ncbi:hypothetical protein ACFZA9_26255 [Streptomyces olivaceus]|uniref:hypothetical protein n=1 Tax=Streptomyces olivaceus TaxID=47716 RepID=UPI0036E2EB57